MQRSNNEPSDNRGRLWEIWNLVRLASLAASRDSRLWRAADGKLRGFEARAPDPGAGEGGGVDREASVERAAPPEGRDALSFADDTLDPGAVPGE